MKTKTIAAIAAFSLLPLVGYAQTPPAPPSPPSQPVPPVPPNPPKDKGPKVPVTYLGVETSEVPRVVSEQLGLPKGFGLVVDYVVPDGPAAAAGVQQSDIIKMLNDQILMEPDQLAKLVRSYAEGTNVTLTILRKGAESKVTVKLAKREVPARKDFFGPDWEKHRHPGHGKDFGMMTRDLENLPDLENMRVDLGDMKIDLGDMNIPNIRDTVREARREALRASREARREGRRAAREFRVMSTDKGAMKSTTIDLGKAQIVCTDPQGEMKIELSNGRRMLTAKDPQGRLLFSGPIETKEELDKLPPEVRQRYDKLEQKDLPAVGATASVSKEDEDDDEDEADENENEEENANDDDNDNEGDTSRASVHQVSLQSFPRSFQVLNATSI